MYDYYSAILLPRPAGHHDDAASLLLRVIHNNTYFFFEYDAFLVLSVSQ
jgi:hypothetical protein